MTLKEKNQKLRAALVTFTGTDDVEELKRMRDVVVAFLGVESEDSKRVLTAIDTLLEVR